MLNIVTQFFIKFKNAFLETRDAHQATMTSMITSTSEGRIEAEIVQNQEKLVTIDENKKIVVSMIDEDLTVTTGNLSTIESDQKTSVVLMMTVGIQKIVELLMTERDTTKNEVNQTTGSIIDVRILMIRSMRGEEFQTVMNLTSDILLKSQLTTRNL